MALEHELAIGLAENELAIRRNHLQAVAQELEERVAWLARWQPADPPLPAPPADWDQTLGHARQELAAERAALLERRQDQLRAEEAALLLWQMQLDTAAEAVKAHERAHKQPPPTPRASLNRNVEAPQLSLDDRERARAVTQEWRMTVEMPQAKLGKDTVSLARSETVTMTPAEHAAADGAVVPRAVKRRTGRMTPLNPAEPRDLVPLATPHDLPSIAPSASQPRPQHRGRAVTEPFVAAMDLDGLYLQRSQLSVTDDGRALQVRLDAETRHAEREDMPTQPQRLMYRSREGDLRFFGLGAAQAKREGDTALLALDIQHWPATELEAFQRALETLP